MKTTHTENRPGRFSDLFKGGAKPRRSFTLMMALVLVGMLSLAGVVSADSFFPGITPTTSWNGVVNGDVYVQYNNTWSSSNPIDYDYATATFTGIPSGITVKEARLYIVPYVGNINATYTGTLYSTWTTTGDPITLSDEEPLNLAYPPAAAREGTSDESPDYLLYLNRVTSDYVVAYDVTSLVDSTSATVDIRTTNVSGKFDGRIKEAKLVIAYNVSSGSTETTRYWVNEGNDPITYYGDSTAGATTFAVSNPGTITSATLYTDDIASANGTYTWNGPTVTPTTIASNSYARLNQFTLGTNTISTSNTLTYNRVGNYYKLALAILKIKS